MPISHPPTPLWKIHVVIHLPKKRLSEAPVKEALIKEGLFLGPFSFFLERFQLEAEGGKLTKRDGGPSLSTQWA